MEVAGNPGTVMASVCNAPRFCGETNIDLSVRYFVCA